jgi:two-component system chemotaxis response regulator CheY
MSSVKTRVLLVDDSKAASYMLEKIISELPEFEVVGIAGSGEEAIDLFKKENPDLITMDIVLPGMNGIATMKAIRQISKEVIIIVISSLGSSQDTVFEALKYGAKNVINKPFNKDVAKKILLQYAKK